MSRVVHQVMQQCLVTQQRIWHLVGSANRVQQRFIACAIVAGMQIKAMNGDCYVNT